MDIFKNLKSDKFRTFLSLFGISIGIFAIVAVLAIVDSLNNTIKRGFDSLGRDLVLVQTVPLDITGEYGQSEWREYLRRPPISYEDYRFVRNNSRAEVSMSYISTADAVLKSGKRMVKGATCAGVAGEWSNVISPILQEGRIFSRQELSSGENVCIIGEELRKTLFGDERAAGKTVQILGAEFRITGCFSREGKNAMSLYSVDNLAVVPIGSAVSLFDINQPSSLIAVKPEMAELRTLLRSSRRLSPSQKDNFAINSFTYLANQTEDLIKTVDKIGLIVAAFSLLVGIFGIVNIMFVSVKEQTREIGIKKALGAKREVIILQFLSESALLSLLGGDVGIGVAVLAASFLPESVMEVSVRASHIETGLVTALIAGVMAGVFPAVSASRLDPVKAISE